MISAIRLTHTLRDCVATEAPKPAHWAEIISSRRADRFKEQEILPDFVIDFFAACLLRTLAPAENMPFAPGGFKVVLMSLL